jgi:hypothetical protein
MSLLGRLRILYRHEEQLRGNGYLYSLRDALARASGHPSGGSPSAGTE